MTTMTIDQEIASGDGPRGAYADDDCRVYFDLNSHTLDKFGNDVYEGGWEWTCVMPSAYIDGQGCQAKSKKRYGGGMQSMIAPAYKTAKNARRGWKRHASKHHGYTEAAEATTERDKILNQPTTVLKVLKILLDMEVFDPRDIEDRDAIDTLVYRVQMEGA